jgi:hypothetical protein
MSILAGLAALIGTVGVQIVKVIIVDVPSAIAAAGSIIVGVAQK